MKNKFDGSIVLDAIFNTRNKIILAFEKLDKIKLERSRHSTFERKVL